MNNIDVTVSLYIASLYIVIPGTFPEIAHLQLPLTAFVFQYTHSL